MRSIRKSLASRELDAQEAYEFGVTTSESLSDSQRALASHFLWFAAQMNEGADALTPQDDTFDRLCVLLTDCSATVRLNACTLLGSLKSVPESKLEAAVNKRSGVSAADRRTSFRPTDRTLQPEEIDAELSLTVDSDSAEAVATAAEATGEALRAEGTAGALQVALEDEVGVCELEPFRSPCNKASTN